MQPSRNTRLMVAGLAALMLAGCVKQDAPGVGIQKLAADIVFGVKPADTTPPPNLQPGQAGPGDAHAVGPGAPEPARPAGGNRFGNFPRPARPPRPPPAPGDADRAAEVDVPAGGAHRLPRQGGRPDR